MSESTPEVLAGVRAYAHLFESGCRSFLHMPPMETPLSDAQLSKIDFHAYEDFYEGDRIAHFETIRVVIADSSSQCKPYVYVHRTAKLADGCEALVTGQSGVFLKSPDPLAAPPDWSPSTRVMPGQCPVKPREHHLEGVPADDAGAGIKCVWASRLMRADLSPAVRARFPAAEPGNGPVSRGVDTCLWQQMPDYAKGEPVFLRTHMTPEADAQKREAMLAISGGHSFFGFNSRLRAFETGGASGGARLTKAGVEAFVRLSPTEAVPAP